MIVFHHNDADGRCAAAIVKHWFDTASTPSMEHSCFKAVEMDYKDKPPLGSIDPYDTVVIVDFSFKPEDMKTIMATTKMGVVWCDHHKTAKDYDYGREIAGVRDFTDKGLCGAELTWKFFFPEKHMPYWLTLLGDYDAWRMTHREECLAFYEGLKLCVQDPEYGIWHALLKEEHLWDKIRDEGKICIFYRDNYCGEMRKSFGFETVIGGQKAYALNTYRFGSQGFGEKAKEYPICISFVYDGKQFTVSLYSETVDVSTIAKSFGGGGHKGAAGFICKELPFTVLEPQ
jgi:oligoribonuclease NrnB/cAMP/cGMP phosphodiesterase (DHH superfamily)